LCCTLLSVTNQADICVLGGSNGLCYAYAEAQVEREREGEGGREARPARSSSPGAYLIRVARKQLH
jgi:hypothetical protein